MKKFSELGVTVQDERKMFNCSQVSISDVLNCEIIVRFHSRCKDFAR